MFQTFKPKFCYVIYAHKTHNYRNFAFSCDKKMYSNLIVSIWFTFRNRKFIIKYDDIEF